MQHAPNQHTIGRIQHLAVDSKSSHPLRFQVLKQVRPRELLGDQLSRCHAWAEHERSLNQLSSSLLRDHPLLIL